MQMDKMHSLRKTLEEDYFGIDADGQIDLDGGLYPARKWMLGFRRHLPGGEKLTTNNHLGESVSYLLTRSRRQTGAHLSPWCCCRPGQRVGTQCSSGCS